MSDPDFTFPPSYDFDRDIIRGGELLRRFTNRRDYIEIFHKKLKQPPPVPVLVFYGVGGSGKTWLAEYLKAKHLNLSVPHPHAYINFQRDPTDTEPINALWSIRCDLK